MKNFDWEAFREGREIAVHCNTEEKAKDFLKKCIDNGVKYWYGDELIKQDNDTIWNDCCAGTCYSNTDNIEYENLGWYQGKNYKIVEWIIEGNDDAIDITIVNQEQTEFTYQEVIARIKDGETYEIYGKSLLSKARRLQKITREEDDIIFSGELMNGYIVSAKTKYKLQESKQEYEIHHIVFPDSDYMSKFRSDEDYICDEDFVICNMTDNKKVYGKLLQTLKELMTEKEYLELNLIEYAK